MNPVDLGVDEGGRGAGRWTFKDGFLVRLVRFLVRFWGVRTINRPINRSTFCLNNVRTILKLLKQCTVSKITWQNVKFWYEK
jgi:hypothetical protein